MAGNVFLLSPSLGIIDHIRPITPTIIAMVLSGDFFFFLTLTGGFYALFFCPL